MAGELITENDAKEGRLNMEGVDAQKSTRAHHAVLAGFLGWTLDAFDFFVVIFLIDTLAHQFGVPKKEIIHTLMWTLAMRPLGALLFGVLWDRFGRWFPLMANVIYFSIIELLRGFSPNYTFFLVMRALFGIGMGGEWGVGASLVMEAAPIRLRGILSGILQSGYSIGYLLAAVVTRFMLPVWGWPAMFWIGALPAFLALYIRSKVPESEASKQHHATTTGQVLRVVIADWRRFAYLVVLMATTKRSVHAACQLFLNFVAHTHQTTPESLSWSERESPAIGRSVPERQGCLAWAGECAAGGTLAPERSATGASS